MSESTTKKKNRKKVIVIIVLAIILALLIIFMIAYPTSNNESNVSQSSNAPDSTPKILNDDREGINGTYQYMTREEILAALQDNQQMVTDKVSSNVTFPSGQTGVIGEWLLENSEENTVIQQAEIYFNNDVLIAKTEPVYPEQYIHAVELLADLETGEYEAVVYINYYDVDDKTFAGQAGYKIRLTVE